MQRRCLILNIFFPPGAGFVGVRGPWRIAKEDKGRHYFSHPFPSTRATHTKKKTSTDHISDPGLAEFPWEKASGSFFPTFFYLNP